MVKKRLNRKLTIQCSEWKIQGEIEKKKKTAILQFKIKQKMILRIEV